MRPELEVLLTLRRSPALVIVAADEAAGASAAIQMYVGAEATGEVMAVLAERIAGDNHAFLLCTRAAAIHELTSWCVRPAGGNSITETLGAPASTVRTVDTYHPSPEAWLGYRIAVGGSPQGEVTLQEGTIGGELSLPMKVTEEMLEDALSRALTPLRPPGSGG